jgi:hypothetical protein
MPSCRCSWMRPMRIQHLSASQCSASSLNVRPVNSGGTDTVHTSLPVPKVKASLMEESNPGERAAAVSMKLSSSPDTITWSAPARRK